METATCLSCYQAEMKTLHRFARIFTLITIILAATVVVFFASSAARSLMVLLPVVLLWFLLLSLDSLTALDTGSLLLVCAHRQKRSRFEVYVLYMGRTGWMVDLPLSYDLGARMDRKLWLRWFRVLRSLASFDGAPATGRSQYVPPKP